MSEVRLENVTKRYGEFVAVNNVSLLVREGEFLTILGPSGCGKTTTLRMVAGFVHPDSGIVVIRNTDVSRTPSYRRNTGMVFQSYALFPHLTVEENIAYGLRVRKVPAAERRQHVKEALDLVQLSHLAARYPRQLSGGQQQRVALARAVAIKPDILLLDEPIGALDLKLRHELQIEIKRVQERLGITTLYVTHDQGEALSLSDRVAVMRSGEIQQLDTPNVLYNHPNSNYVANFVGRTNAFAVEVVDRTGEAYTVRACSSPDTTFTVRQTTNAAQFSIGAKCSIAFRPERASISGEQPNRIKARVENIRYYGSIWTVALKSELAGSLLVEHRQNGAMPFPDGEVSVFWSPSDCFLLPLED